MYSRPNHGKPLEIFSFVHFFNSITHFHYGTGCGNQFFHLQHTASFRKKPTTPEHPLLLGICWVFYGMPKNCAEFFGHFMAKCNSGIRGTDNPIGFYATHLQTLSKFLPQNFTDIGEGTWKAFEDEWRRSRLGYQ